MAAATDNRRYCGVGSNLGRGAVAQAWNGPVAANAVLKVGALAGTLLTDTGNPQALYDFLGDGTMRPVGFVTVGADNTGGAVNARPTRVLAETGLLIDKNAGAGSAIAMTDLYAKAYAVDNQTVSKTAIEGVLCGIITGIDKETGQIVVLVDPVIVALL